MLIKFNQHLLYVFAEKKFIETSIKFSSKQCGFFTSSFIIVTYKQLIFCYNTLNKKKFMLRYDLKYDKTIMKCVEYYKSGKNLKNYKKLLKTIYCYVNQI